MKLVPLPFLLPSQMRRHFIHLRRIDQSRKNVKLFEKHALQGSSHQRILLEIWPDIPPWNKPPVLNEYLLKPLLIWHPENQFGIPIAKEECPNCKKHGSLKSKEYTKPHHIHCLTMDAYMVSVRYVCQRKMGG